MDTRLNNQERKETQENRKVLLRTHLPETSNTHRNGTGTLSHIRERAVRTTKLGLRSYSVDAHACIRQQAGLSVLFPVYTCLNLQAHKQMCKRQCVILQ